MFSIVVAPIYIPTNSALVFPFLHILTICKNMEGPKAWIDLEGTILTEIS